MRFRAKDYDEAVHEVWMALSVRQPDADYLCRPVCLRNNGTWAACKSSLELPFGTKHRGDILIVSTTSKCPSVHPPGVTIGIVNLVEVIMQDNGVYLWQFDDPRMVVPFEVKHSPPRGLWKYVCPRGEVTPYPRYLAF